MHDAMGIEDCVVCCIPSYFQMIKFLHLKADEAWYNP